MSGRNARLKGLESRRQLLIAESELNRAHLVHELQTVGQEVRGLVRETHTFSAMAAAAMTLVAGLASSRPKESAPAAERPSWWQKILKGAEMAGSFWSDFRSHARAKRPADGRENGR